MLLPVAQRRDQSLQVGQLVDYQGILNATGPLRFEQVLCSDLFRRCA